MDKQQKNGNWFKRHKILTAVFILVGCFLLLGAITSGSKGEQTPKAEAKYEAEVRNYSVADSATLRVDIKVHNVGNAAGKPSCHIEADNGTRAYHGFDRVERTEDLSPDGWWGFAQNITVSNQGAAHVKEVTVNCK